MVSGDPGVVLASLNLHGGRGGDRAPFDVAAACLSLKADIIVLQEAWCPDGHPDSVAEAGDAIGAQLIRADLATGTDLRRLRIAPDTARGRWGLAALTTLPVA